MTTQTRNYPEFGVGGGALFSGLLIIVFMVLMLFCFMVLMLFCS